MKEEILGRRLLGLRHRPYDSPAILKAVDRWFDTDGAFTKWIHVTAKVHWSEEEFLALVDREGEYQTPVDAALNQYFMSPDPASESALVHSLEKMTEMRKRYMLPKE